MSDVAENLQEIQNRIASALQRAGRKREDVELMVVSKTFPAEIVREAVDAGHRLFGENRVQELLAKQPELPDNLRWHLIGHLQSNKVRKILPVAEALHGVDKLDIARDIQRIASEHGLFPKVYLEINVGGESTKFGFTPEQIKAQLEDLLALDRLEIQGLMCIPPPAEDAEGSRPYFIMLRDLRDDLEKQAGIKLPGLSMGMSGDYEIAIEEGATMVRVGSAVFGKRVKA